jgi:ribosome-associated toxin RatA of RatAB toxin-antitoxin module
MREMHRTALVPYSAEQMFDLIEVGFRDLHVRVTTRNAKRRPEWMVIAMEDGSFRHFHGEWSLKPLGELGCRVDFSLRYELALHAERVAGPLIDHAANRMVDAFVSRAEALYGPDNRTNPMRQPAGG